MGLLAKFERYNRRAADKQLANRDHEAVVRAEQMAILDRWLARSLDEREIRRARYREGLARP